jgi:CBS domain-containing protein
MASTISELMTTRPVAVTAQTPVREAARLMAEEELDWLPVVEDGPPAPKETTVSLDLLGLALLHLGVQAASSRRGSAVRSRLRGIITDRDLAVRVVPRGLDPGKTRAGEIASTDVVTLTPEDDVDTALRMMARTHVQRLPVVNAENELVGTIAQADLRPS